MSPSPARTASPSFAIALLLITAALGVPLLTAATPTDLSGQAFTIYIGDGGAQKDRLVFNTKEASLPMVLGDAKIPYTMSAKRKSYTFSAKQTNADGSIIDIEGTITGQDVTGTISMTPKGGTAQTLNYTSTKPKN
jgi:hypothetical protein